MPGNEKPKTVVKEELHTFSVENGEIEYSKRVEVNKEDFEETFKNLLEKFGLGYTKEYLYDLQESTKRPISEEDFREILNNAELPDLIKLHELYLQRSKARIRINYKTTKGLPKSTSDSYVTPIPEGFHFISVMDVYNEKVTKPNKTL